jgi:hypothetical protein
MSNVKAIKDAAELYYLANGQYPTDDITKLDFDLPGCISKGGGQLDCPNASYNYNGNLSTGQVFDVYGIYPSYDAPIISYRVVLDHAQSLQGKRYCIANTNNNIAQKTCSSMGGEKISSSAWEL